MIRGMGFLLVVCACAAAGWRGRQTLRNRVRCLTDAEHIAQLLRLHVCICREPLPMVLERLERDFPERFAGMDNIYAGLKDISFGEFWRACVAAAGFVKEAMEPLAEAVEAISGGQLPERAMDTCEEILRQRRREAMESEREKGRIYMAFGTAGGFLLALILL